MVNFDLRDPRALSTVRRGDRRSTGGRGSGFALVTFVASLFLVVRPLLLVPGAPSSVLAPSSNARSAPSSF